MMSKAVYFEVIISIFKFETVITFNANSGHRTGLSTYLSQSYRSIISKDEIKTFIT